MTHECKVGIRVAGLLGVLLLTGCATENPAGGSPNFMRMSAAQLQAHNANLPVWEQIVCVSERRSDSHLKRRACMTLEDFQQRELGVVDRVHSAGTDSRVSIEAR